MSGHPTPVITTDCLSPFLFAPYDSRRELGNDIVTRLSGQVIICILFFVFRILVLFFLLIFTFSLASLYLLSKYSLHIIKM